MLLSDHGHPLVYQGEPWTSPIITVENYLKWYTLYLIMPDGEIRPFLYTGLILPPESSKFGSLGSTFIDHVPNPAAVVYTAEKNKMFVDPLSFEAIVGRWFIEVKNWDFGEIPFL
jgi:hypothetical protein